MPYLWSEMTEIYTIFNHNYTYGNFWCRFLDTFFDEDILYCLKIKWRFFGLQKMKIF